MVKNRYKSLVSKETKKFLLCHSSEAIETKIIENIKLQIIKNEKMIKKYQ